MTIQIINSLRKEGIKWHHAMTLRSWILAWYALLTEGEAKWSAMMNFDSEGVDHALLIPE